MRVKARSYSYRPTQCVQSLFETYIVRLTLQSTCKMIDQLKFEVGYMFRIKQYNERIESAD